ncbi:MAG: hypothetical protein Q9225_003928 [Loekoesia sp. 1 TL-2023]
MKLDTTHLRYLTPENWRVLTAVEIGSKNHEVIPTQLILQISNLRSGSGAHKSISTLAKANLIARVQHAKYDGYRLTYGGLDYLALHTHFQRKTLHSTGPCIGTGKESDIHIVLAPPSSSSLSPISSKSHSSTTSPINPAQPSPSSQTSTRQLILKIHRLGRISFRTIKTNRDYLRHRSSATWLYMSRLSALKEYTFMTALHEIGFPVPRPVAWNRHTVVMSLIEGTPLYQIRNLEVEQARKLYAELMAMIVRLAGVGLIHGDFNEFNIMIEEREEGEKSGSSGPQSNNDAGQEAQDKRQIDTINNNDDSKNTITLYPILIDFPQMISISHPNAATYFDRDVNCIKRYFSRRYHFTSDDPGPFFADVEKQMRKNKGGRRLDIEVEASGFSKKMAKELERYMEDVGVEGDRDGGSGYPSSENSDESDELDESDESFGGETGQDGNADRTVASKASVARGLEDQEVTSIIPGSVPLQGAKREDLGVPVSHLSHMSIASAIS